MFKGTSMIEHATSVLAKEQGLNDKESRAFAEAMHHEYSYVLVDMSEACEFLDAMCDFELKEVEEPKDDFIVGEVCKAGMFPTDIVSREELPSHFYGKQVEIRLKEIVKKPEKFKYERTDYITPLPIAGGIRHYTNGNIQGILERCVGKKVKITIEEVE
jgi:hypothetical protein